MRTVLLALGSNVGDRRENLREAVSRLSCFVQDLVCSAAVETLPIDCAAKAPPFFNAAVCGKTDLKPLALLAACQRIEREMGRPAVRAHHADRIIDVDILVMDGVRMDTPALTLPHPRMHQRDFVMHPVAELLPDLLIETLGISATRALALVSMKSITKTNITF